MLAWVDSSGHAGHALSLRLGPWAGCIQPKPRIARLRVWILFVVPEPCIEQAMADMAALSLEAAEGGAASVAALDGLASNCLRLIQNQSG